MTQNTPLKTRDEIVALLSEAIHSRQGQEKHLWLDDCLKLAEASILELEQEAIKNHMAQITMELEKGTVIKPKGNK